MNADQQTPATQELDEDVLDEAREHFVNGSGAYADTKLVAALVNEIDRLRAEARATAQPSPAPSGVHNHGPEDGPGVGCREYLVGECRFAAAHEAAFCTAQPSPAPALREALFKVQVAAADQLESIGTTRKGFTTFVWDTANAALRAPTPGGTATTALRERLEALAASWSGDADFLEEGDKVHNRSRIVRRTRKASPRELAAEAARQCAVQLLSALSPEPATEPAEDPYMVAATAQIEVNRKRADLGLPPLEEDL